MITSWYPKISKLLIFLYYGHTTEICEAVFLFEGAKEIWDYLCFQYATNEKVLDFDMIEQVGNDIDPCEKRDEMINADAKIQNVKDHGHLKTRYNDKSGQ